MNPELTPGEIEWIDNLQNKLVNMFQPAEFSKEHLYLVGAIRMAYEEGKSAGYHQHVDEMFNIMREQQGQVLKSLIGKSDREAQP